MIFQSSLNKNLEMFCSVDYITDISRCFRYALIREYRRDSETGISGTHPSLIALEVYVLMLMNCLQRAFFQDERVGAL
jgi:hypothetical protein